MIYLFEVTDCDGNDASVFDALVSADTREAASAKLWAYLDKAYPGDESDGGYETFHPCDCSCEHRKTMVCAQCVDKGWLCEHGGLLTNEDRDGDYGPRAFPDYESANEARAFYHGLIDLTE